MPGGDFCPQMGVLLWMPKKLQPPVHGEGAWRGCTVPGGSICPRRGCLVWMQKREEKCNRLSTERVPGVDSRCPLVPFVHRWGCFCGRRREMKPPPLPLCCCGGIYSTRICSIWEVVVVTFTLPAIWRPGMQMIFPVASHRTITLLLCRCSNFMSER